MESRILRTQKNLMTIFIHKLKSLFGDFATEVGGNDWQRGVAFFEEFKNLKQ